MDATAPGTRIPPGTTYCWRCGRYSTIRFGSSAAASEDRSAEYHRYSREWSAIEQLEAALVDIELSICMRDGLGSEWEEALIAELVALYRLVGYR